MDLRVREVFATIQGEGSRTGSPAVFIRLAGCNLWSGHEEGRAAGRGDCAAWCDTQFIGGERMTGAALADRALQVAEDAGMVRPLFVVSGGEPLLQLGSGRRAAHALELLDRLRAVGETALETNGTRPMLDWLAPKWDHVTVSPKGLRAAPGSVEHLRAFKVTDLKVVVPCPMEIAALAALYPHDHLYLQPRDDGEQGRANMAEAQRLAATLGGRLSVQTHKYIGVP